MKSNKQALPADGAAVLSRPTKQSRSTGIAFWIHYGILHFNRVKRSGYVYRHHEREHHFTRQLQCGKRKRSHSKVVSSAETSRHWGVLSRPIQRQRSPTRLSLTEARSRCLSGRPASMSNIQFVVRNGSTIDSTRIRSEEARTHRSRWSPVRRSSPDMQRNSGEPEQRRREDSEHSVRISSMTVTVSQAGFGSCRRRSTT